VSRDRRLQPLVGESLSPPDSNSNNTMEYHHCVLFTISDHCKVAIEVTSPF